MTRAATRVFPLTVLLDSWKAGDAGAFQMVSEFVYDELRRLAQSHMRGERESHTLQPTALVNDALIKLDNSDIEFANRAHFYAIASRTMRQLLVDHARHVGRQKRGGDAQRVTLSTQVAGADGPKLDILDLDRALSRLGERDPRKADIVELHYFAGLTMPAIADCLGMSERSVHRDLRLAKAWLRRELSSEIA